MWNVKLLKGILEPVIGEVLIETLWNVKILKANGEKLDGPRINRNIVECKEGNHADRLYIKGQVLIETLWNVKIISQSLKRSVQLVLIETLWNVKAPIRSIQLFRSWY